MPVSEPAVQTIGVPLRNAISVSSGVLIFPVIRIETISLYGDSAPSIASSLRPCAGLITPVLKFRSRSTAIWSGNRINSSIFVFEYPRL
jgi:hypothetical protein